MIQEQLLRRSQITLPLPSVLAIGASLSTFIAPYPFRIIGAQLVASDSGVGAGATTVIVKRNGMQVPTQAPLSVAQGAATLSTMEPFIGTPSNYPGGQGISKGDKLTVDCTAIPATTPPKCVVLILSVVQTDV
jgi:hypothetical protein